MKTAKQEVKNLTSKPLSERPHALGGFEQTLTKQSFKDECDINQIMMRYQKTGIIDHVNTYGERYAELDGSTYLDHMNQVAEATNMFEDLPSRARNYFENDPAKFLDYVSNMEDTPEQRRKLVELGLSNHRVVINEEEPTPNQPREAPPSTED